MKNFNSGGSFTQLTPYKSDEGGMLCMCFCVGSIITDLEATYTPHMKGWRH